MLEYVGSPRPAGLGRALNTLVMLDRDWRLPLQVFGAELAVVSLGQLIHWPPLLTLGISEQDVAPLTRAAVA